MTVCNINNIDIGEIPNIDRTFVLIGGAKLVRTEAHSTRSS